MQPCKISVPPGFVDSDAEAVASLLSHSLVVLFDLGGKGAEMVFEDPQPPGETRKIWGPGVLGQLCPELAAFPKKIAAGPGLLGMRRGRILSFKYGVRGISESSA
jgi:hypothetical protein